MSVPWYRYRWSVHSLLLLSLCRACVPLGCLDRRKVRDRKPQRREVSPRARARLARAWPSASARLGGLIMCSLWWTPKQGNQETGKFEYVKYEFESLRSSQSPRIWVIEWIAWHGGIYLWINWQALDWNIEDKLITEKMLHFCLRIEYMYYKEVKHVKVKILDWEKNLLKDLHWLQLLFVDWQTKK